MKPTKKAAKVTPQPESDSSEEESDEEEVAPPPKPSKDKGIQFF